MNRYTYFITILILLISLISGVYAVTVCKCSNNTKGKRCGVELECTPDSNDDPNYGYADIWQCGPDSPETNFCWYGHCGTDGCCQNIGRESCCKGDPKCNGCDLLIAPKPPGTTTRTEPGKCSYSPTGMSFQTSTGANPPNTSPTKTSLSNTSSPNTSPPSTSPIQDKNKVDVIVGSTIGSVLGLIIIIIGVRYIYIRKEGNNPNYGNVRNNNGDDGDD